MEKNPKETAIELINQFENVPMLQDYGGMDHELAVECARITIEEKIKEVSFIVNPDRFQYLLIVKFELLSL
jgi:uncharacterized protein YjfI (DUF2170 family)